MRYVIALTNEAHCLICFFLYSNTFRVMLSFTSFGVKLLHDNHPSIDGARRKENKQKLINTDISKQRLYTCSKDANSRLFQKRRFKVQIACSVNLEYI